MQHVLIQGVEKQSHRFFSSRFLHICNTELFCLMVNTLFLSIEVSLKMLNSAGNNSSSDLVSVYLKVFDL